MVNPVTMVSHMIPPGNTITGLTVSPDGTLIFEFEGNDVPREEEGTPEMRLVAHRDAVGVIEHWFEQAPAPQQPNPHLRELIATLFEEKPGQS
jgi:hypothetical protein